jgi:hypothetical protein
MAYTTINKSTEYFNTVTWTGTSSSPLNVTGYGFQPDWVWNKYRSGAGDHQIYDSVRTATKMLIPNGTNAESTNANGVTAFITDGFTAGSDINVNGGNSVAWGWKAGTTSGITTNGSTVVTPSAYSFNQTSGFSIVKYAGNGNTTTKVAHGLGAAPKMIIIKNLDDTDGDNWKVYHVGIGNTIAIQLDNDGAASGGSDNFYDTDPDTVNFTLGNHVSVNNNGENYIAYCFAAIKGFSSFGKYTGNGNADGPFVYTGFKPAFVLVKNTTASNNWFIQDNQRAGYNGANYLLKPNTNGAEDTGTHIDMLSNGFKTIVSSANCNGDGNTMIYMAFAEAPFVGTNNIPATAR